MNMFDIERGLKGSGAGYSPSQEVMFCATQESEQLDGALARVLKWQRRFPSAIPLPDGFPVGLTSQRSGQVQGDRESVVLAVQAWMVSVSDRKTSHHAQRIMWLAEATARQLAQSEEEIHQLCLAALLHDIGKVGIPAAVLHKPGPLTPEEWSILRGHPDIGRQVLEQAGGIFHPVASIVGMHHERWDGNGYPRGVATDAIPLSARILAVVDAYDAMTSRRVYQWRPYSVAQACRELQRCAGSQFDPWVVQAFLHLPARAIRTYSLAARVRNKAVSRERDPLCCYMTRLFPFPVPLSVVCAMGQGRQRHATRLTLCADFCLKRRCPHGFTHLVCVWCLCPSSGVPRALRFSGGATI